MTGLDATIRSVIFDLDGTLVDSLDDIAASLNHVLAARGLPTHAREVVEGFVGDGARLLVRRAIPEGVDEDDVLSTFRAYYTEHLTDHTRVYDGVRELLAELARRGVPTAVLSNKPHDMTVRLVAALFPEHPFVRVLGQRDHVPKKPDPAAALELAEHLPAPIAFVGDTPVDVATGRAAGHRAIGVAWGMRDASLLREAGAEAILERPADLLARLAVAIDPAPEPVRGKGMLDGPFRIAERPVHLGLGARVVQLPPFTGDMAWYEAYGAEHAADGVEGRLVTIGSFSAPWASWEVHPLGEELVVCLSGEITLHQEIGDEVRTVVLTPGEAIVNPRGVWHTADVAIESSALFITAGAGTDHRPR